VRWLGEHSVELVMPAQFGLELQFPAAKHGHVNRTEVALTLEVSALGGDPITCGRDDLSSGLHHRQQLLPVAEPPEHQGHTKRVRAEVQTDDGLFAEDAQFAPPLRGDLVDGAGRSPADLLRPERFDQAFFLHPVEFPVQGANVNATPVADVGHLRISANLMAVPRTVVGQ
jgi:hypothetical protein